jgi:hypothetical protein
VKMGGYFRGVKSNFPFFLSTAYCFFRIVFKVCNMSITFKQVLYLEDIIVVLVSIPCISIVS